MKRLAPIAVVLAFAGCGGSIDGDDLEAEITEDAEQQAGLVLDAVDCPSPDTKKDSAFECTVTVKGQDTQLEVVQTDDDGNVAYDLRGLAEGPAVNDTAGDKASIESVIDAVNGDVTALCDYATPAYRKQLAGTGSCAEAVLADYDDFLDDDYGVSAHGDIAKASDGRRIVTLERQKNGSWLITDVR